jgi:WD40 repeat protein
MRLAFRAEPPALIILEMRNAARLAARILHAMSDSPPSDPGEEQDARLIHVDNAQGMQVGDYGIQDNRSTSVTAGRDALIAGRDINVENLHVHSGESSPKTERRPDSGWSVPPFMAPALPLAFVERPAVASRLEGALIRGQDARTVVLTGPSGFGKSILAAWACQRASVREHFPDGVLWVELGQRRGLGELTVSILTDFVTLLTGERTLYETVQAASEAFAGALGERRILLVIDGAWRVEDARWFLRGGARCVRLITTQRHLPVASDEIPVKPLTAAEAGTLLRHAVPTASAGDLTPLLDRAGGSPLVLAMLNGLLRDLRGLPLDSAVANLAVRLDRQGVSLLDRLADGHGNPTAGQAFAIALEELAATAPDQEQALDRYASLTGFPPGETIAYSLLESLWGLDQVEVRARCGQLLSRSLITTAEDGVRLHDIFHELLHDRYPGRAAQASRQLLVAARPAAGWHALTGVLRAGLANQLAFHLIQAGRAAELGNLLRDLRYLTARIREEGFVALEEDLRAYADAASGNGESAQDLLRYLRRNAHLVQSPGMREPDLALALYSRLFSRFPVEHAEEALPGRGLVPERALPDLADSRLARSVPGHRGQVSAVAWQADGLLMSVGGDDGILRRWRQHSGTLVSETSVCEDLVLRAPLSPDGSHLAMLVHPRPGSTSAWPKATILRFQIVSTATGDTVAYEYMSADDYIDGSKRATAWSPDSAVLALPCSDGIRFWSPFGVRSSRRLLYSNGVSALSWHPDRGLACLTHGSVIVWPDPLASDSHLSLGLFSDEHYPRSLAWSPDGTRIVAAADDRLELIDASQHGGLRRAWGGWGPGLGSPAAIAWRPDSGAFAVASNHAGIPVQGSMISLWDVGPMDGTQSVSLIDTRYAGILDVAWQPSGECLAAAYTDSTLRLWHPQPGFTGEAAEGDRDPLGWKDRTLHAVYRALRAVGQEENSRDLVRNLPDSGVMVTRYGDAAPGRAPLSVTRSGPDRWLLSLNHADTGLVTVAEWDSGWALSSTQACQDFKMPAMVAVHTFGLTDVDLTLRHGAVGEVLKRVVWRAPRCLAIDPGGSYLATASETGHITLLDLGTLDHICEIRIDEAAQGCAFDPEGARLAVTGQTGVYLFRVGR